MIRQILYILLGMSLLLTACHTSERKNSRQLKPEPLGYRIEGEEVIFVFDVREYDKASQVWGRMVDFKDLNIYEIAIAGEFNGWSHEGWTMYKIDEYQYQLRKKLKDFKGKLEWQYKFVVNGRYWAEPPKNVLNKSGVDNNLLLHTAVASLEGNTTFRLKGFKDAFRVVLAGSFNDWNESELLFGREAEDWVCRTDLTEGKYHYKFIVDGEWMTDPANFLIEDDGDGNLNSVLYIGGKPQTFRLKGFEDAYSVILAGSFNNWHTEQMLCKKIGKEWQYTINLPKGKYHYKFIVDGRWMIDPDNPDYEGDGRGNTNSIWVVR